MAHRRPPVNKSPYRTGLATSQSPATVVGIKIRGLFGQFDYDIPALQPQESGNNLVILYGDNGSGKTTILLLLFHLLSSANDKGHRNAIRHIPFRHFEVSLSSKTTIALSRPEHLTGGYEISVKHGKQQTLKLSFGLDPDRENRFGSDEEETSFIKTLHGLSFTVYLLSADRNIKSDILESQEPDGAEMAAVRRVLKEEAFLRRTMHVRHTHTQADGQADALSRAIELASGWIKNQVLQAANRGAGSSHNIYADIVKRVLATRSKEPENSIDARAQELTRSLISLSERAQGYARYGFIPPLPVDEMIPAISDAPPETVRILERILEPYIQGTNARLKELEAIVNLTEAFVRNLNKFYSRKKVSFDLNEGLAVRLDDGSDLRPSWLSSGEKHLLLLFCHALVSNDRNSIFIIDEPELSLNIKWQRMLIDSLLEIVKGSGVQFILATHAIELLAGYNDRVLELEPYPTSKKQSKKEDSVGSSEN